MAAQQPARVAVRREKPALIINEESLVPKGYYAGIDLHTASTKASLSQLFCTSQLGPWNWECC